MGGGASANSPVMSRLCTHDYPHPHAISQSTYVLSLSIKSSMPSSYCGNGLIGCVRTVNCRWYAGRGPLVCLAPDFSIYNEAVTGYYKRSRKEPDCIPLVDPEQCRVLTSVERTTSSMLEVILAEHCRDSACINEPQRSGQERSALRSSPRVSERPLPGSVWPLVTG